MFNRMRRQDRLLSQDETERILQEGTYGILSLNGLNGYPHAVPMSYVLVSGVLWMHAATAGTKLDALRADPHASFSVVGATEVLPSEFTTRYESAIVHGKITEVTGEAARTGLLLLAEKYAPGLVAESHAYVERYLPMTTVLRFDVEHLSGKANR